MGSELLGALEERLLRMGVAHRAILPQGETGHEALLNQGYELTPGIECFEKREPLRPAEAGDAWRRAARRTDPPAPLTLRALHPSASIGLGIGPRGAPPARPDGIPAWMSQHDMNAAGQLPAAPAPILGYDPRPRINLTAGRVAATGA